MKRTRLIILVLIFLLPLIILSQNFFIINGNTAVKVTEGTSVLNDDLYINPGGKLISRGNLTVSGNLLNFAGTFGLMIKADENGTGSLLHKTQLVPATMEQYLSSERWHLVSSPMINSTIETYLDIYLKQWNEPDSTWNFLSLPLSIPMSATVGYSAWASDNLTGTTTINFEGNFNNGNYPVVLSYTSSINTPGWNLISNPYPSALDWNTDSSWNRSNVGGWAVIYDQATFRGWNPFLSGIDRSYNGKTDGIIPATQGFWVRAYDENAFLTIPQSQRLHSTQVLFKDLEQSNYSSLRIKAEANNYEDEAVIIFMEGATEGFDGLYDLSKLYNVDEAPNIYSVSQGNSQYSVNVLPGDFITTSDKPIIPVGFKLGIEEECAISVSGIESFDPYTPIYLEDLKEGVLVNLRNQDTYNFLSNPLNNQHRFLLHFAEPSSVEYQQFTELSIYAFQNQVYVRIPALAKGEAEITDVLGKKISSFSLNQELTSHTVFQTGYYIVKVETDDHTLFGKVFIKY